MAVYSLVNVYFKNGWIITEIQSTAFKSAVYVCIETMMIASIVLLSFQISFVTMTDEYSYFKLGGLIMILIFESYSVTFDADFI